MTLIFHCCFIKQRIRDNRKKILTQKLTIRCLCDDASPREIPTDETRARKRRNLATYPIRLLRNGVY